MNSISLQMWWKNILACTTQPIWSNAIATTNLLIQCVSPLLIQHFWDSNLREQKHRKFNKIWWTRLSGKKKDGAKKNGWMCWNILESTPDRNPLIKSSYKWTRILFIISNFKLGVWLCIQPRIYINLQSKFYDVLTRPYKYLFTHYTKQHTQNTFYI